MQLEFMFMKHYAPNRCLYKKQRVWGIGGCVNRIEVIVQFILKKTGMGVRG